MFLNFDLIECYFGSYGIISLTRSYNLFFFIKTSACGSKAKFVKKLVSDYVNTIM